MDFPPPIDPLHGYDSDLEMDAKSDPEEEDERLDEYIAPAEIEKAVGGLKLHQSVGSRRVNRPCGGRTRSPLETPGDISVTTNRISDSPVTFAFDRPNKRKRSLIDDGVLNSSISTGKFLNRACQWEVPFFRPRPDELQIDLMSDPFAEQATDMVRRRCLSHLAKSIDSIYSSQIARVTPPLRSLVTLRKNQSSTMATERSRQTNDKKRKDAEFSKPEASVRSFEHVPHP